MGFTTQLLYTGSEFMHDLGNLTVIIVGAAAGMMTLYAIYIGFLFATASDPGKRKAARERLYKTVASAFIIIGLATVLGVINVRFNKVEGNVSGTNSGSSGNYSSQYSYGGSVEMALTYSKWTGKTTGVFTIKSTLIKLDGKNIDSNGTEVQFQKCEAVEPSNWTSSTGGTNAFDTSIVGQGTYSFQSNSSTVPCVMYNGVNSVVMSVTFVMKSDKTKTYTMKITVGLSADTGVTLVQY